MELRRSDGSLVATAAVPAIASADAYDVAFDLVAPQSIPVDTYTLRLNPTTVSDVEPANNESGFTGEIDRWIELSGTTQYREDFANLGTTTDDWIDNGQLNGWFAEIANGTTAPGVLRANDGSNTQNGLHNLGQTGAEDRALGSKATSNTANIAYAAVFRNTSSAPLKMARLRYAAELWRSGSVANTSEKITAFYAVTATPLASIASGTSGATALAGADFHSLPAAASTTVSSTTSATALNGNLAANRSVVDYTPALGSEIIIPPGAYFTLKWTDTDEANVVDGQHGIDDVIIDFIETVPTPLVLGSISLGGSPQPLQTAAEVVNFHQTAANEVSIVSGTGTLLTEPISLTPGSEKCLTMTLLAQDTSTTDGFEAADTLQLDLLCTTPSGVITQSLIGDFDIDASGALTGGATAAADEFNLGQQANAVKWLSTLPLVATIPATATSFQLRITAVLAGNSPDTSTEAYRFKDVAVSPCVDTDGDGLHDGLEWAHGTTPTSRTSFLRLSTTAATATQFTITHPSVSTRHYQALTSPNLRTWSRRSTPLPGTASTVTHSMPLPGSDTYLRVLPHPPQTIIP
jgi:hypothetical protein